MPVLIGTSGWQYPHWRGRFYPVGLAQRNWLEHYSERFETVEVNNAFYRLPESHTFEDWKKRTPPDFVVALKASRYITHVKRLHETADPVRRMLEHARHLGRKLGPVLLQLPPNLRRDVAALDEVLAQFPAKVRVAVEFRHDSWFVDETESVLVRHGAALCLSDTPERKTPRWRTTDWGYLRLHAGRATPFPCYGRAALKSWAERLATMWPEPETIYVYFNNDELACALRDAGRLARAALSAGLKPSRVASPREISIG